MKIWDLSYGRINTQPLKTMEHPGIVTSVALSPDATRLVSGVQDGTARIWDVATGRAINVLRGHTDMVSAVAFDSQGKHIGTAGLDGTAKIWDAASGKELLTLKGYNSPVTSIAFSPDGKRVATTGRDGTAKIWDATTGQELVTFTSDDGSVLNDVAFSPDGTRRAVGGDKGVRVFLLKIDDLMALARTRLTRSLTGDECQKYLHQEKAECQASTVYSHDHSHPTHRPGTSLPGNQYRRLV